MKSFVFLVIIAAENGRREIKKKCEELCRVTRRYIVYIRRPPSRNDRVNLCDVKKSEGPSISHARFSFMRNVDYASMRFAAGYPVIFHCLLQDL